MSTSQSDFDEPWAFIPDESPPVDSAELNKQIVYIGIMPYELESYGKPNKDGSIKATLKLWIPF